MIRPLRQRVRNIRKRWWRSSHNPFSTIVSVRTSEPLVGLTFDDGPDPEFTPRLLDVLVRHGARATFFMVGQRVRAHPDIVARVVAEGHAVANHTDTHPSLPTLPGHMRRQELRTCQASLGADATSLFRPPFGHQTLASRLDAYRVGLEVVAWSRDVEDWLHQSASAFESRILKALEPGVVLLLHDGICNGTDPAAEDRSTMLEGLDRALAAASALRFLTLPELFLRGAPHRTRWTSSGA